MPAKSNVFLVSFTVTELRDGYDAAVMLMDHLHENLLRPRSINCAVRGVTGIQPVSMQLGQVGPGPIPQISKGRLLAGEASHPGSDRYTILKSDSKCFDWLRDRSLFIDECLQ